MRVSASRWGRSCVRNLGVGLLAFGLAALALPAAAPGTDARPDTVPVAGAATSTPLRIVQANINKDMGRKKFLSDVSTVMAEQPDIITYNEVHGRPDNDLTPNGYALFRTPGPRKGWAPVAWDTRTWSPVAQGTVKVSKRSPKFDSGMRGVRFANWVTLRNAQKQQVSVISVHIAPNDKKSGTDQLLLPSLRKLKRLAQGLSDRGPVIIGGDFNMGYRSSRYQPGVLAKAGLSSTFDLLGTHFQTHRRGGIIDYVFLGPDPELQVRAHRPVDLRSDHSAVVADLQLNSGPVGAPLPTFKPSRLVIPAGSTKKERRKVRRLQLKAIRATPARAAIHLATPKLRGPKVYDALSKAHKRGVHVTVILGQKKFTARDRALRKQLGTKVTQSSWFRNKRKAWQARVVRGRRVGALKPTELLISQAGATSAFAMATNTTMGKKPLKKHYRRKTRANVRIGLSTYDARYRRYLGHVGRTY